MADSYGYPVHYVLYRLTIPQIIAMLDCRAKRNTTETAPASEDNLPSISQLIHAMPTA